MFKEKIEIRFKNLPYLLKDMEKKEWIIDSFLFKYKGKDYIVLLKLFQEGDIKPSPYAKATVEFFKYQNANDSIMGYVDFYEVRFNNLKDFCKFFDVERSFANRDLFVSFSEIFAKYIPREKTIKKSGVENKLMARRLDGNNPNAVYCFDVRRNGRRENGMPNVRSIDNSNKAKLLRESLYNKYGKDTNLSFFFSDDPKDEKDDEEIMRIFANR